MSVPKGIITAKEAKALSDNWKTLRSTENNRAAGQPDNCSSWYSLEDLQAFLNSVKKSHPEANGVRFYLGVNTTDIDPKGLSTIFMVPTKPNLIGKSTNPNSDILEADGMDRGATGTPPSAIYPQ